MSQLGLSLYQACRREFVLPADCLMASNAEVKRIRKLKEIDDFLNQHHYLHSGTGQKSVGVITRAYGLFIGGMLAGVTVYNPPSTRSIPEYLFGKSYDSAELCQGTLAMSRLVCHPDIPFNSSGFLISHSLRLIREDNQERIAVGKPIFRTVITFADTLFHSGAVYRGVNAWFAGVSDGGGHLGGFYHPETGNYIHVRQGRKTLRLKDCPPGFKPFKASPKLRYLFFTGSKKDQLNTMRRLDPQVKFLCKLEQFSVLKEGRLAKLSDTRSYEEVYRMCGARGTERAGRYADYLSQ